MKVLGLSTDNGKHQLVLTKAVFEKLQLTAGDKILWIEDGE
jgi:hypothetical protein